ncbi:MAG: efflux RND transporter permease subunit [Planctomycetota bacterium]
MMETRVQGVHQVWPRPLITLAAIAFLLPLMAWSLSHLDLENDVAGWLPQDDEQSQLLTWHQELFPDEDRILVSWEGCSITDPRIDEFSANLAGSFATGEREGGSPLVESVTRPADLLRRMRDQQVSLPEAIRRTSGLLTGDGPLCLALNETAQPFSDSVAEAAIALGRQEFGISARRVRQMLPQPSSSRLAKDDADGWSLFDDLNAFVTEQRQPDIQLAWDGMHEENQRNAAFRKALRALQVAGLGNEAVVTETWHVGGAVAGVSVLLSGAGTLDHDAAIDAIRQAATTAGIPPADLRLGGRSVAAAELNSAVVSAAWNSSAPAWNLWLRSPILVSACVGFVCSWLMLRSLRLCLMVQLTALLTAIAATALIQPLGGSMNMVLAVMPTLLFVITISGTMHLCNYWRHSPHGNPEIAIAASVQQAWLPCALSSGTTAIGLASLLSSTLIPVRDFGFFAAIGCLLSLGAVLYVLPAMMRLWPANPQITTHAESAAWNRFAHGLLNWSGVNLVFTAAVVLAAVAGLRNFQTETRAICSFPKSSDLVQDYQRLESDLAGIVPVDAIVRFSRTQQENLSLDQRARAVLQLQERLRQHPQISGALSLASFLCPDAADAGHNASATAENVPRKPGGRVRAELMEDRIRDAVTKPGDKPSLISSFLAVPSKTASLDSSGRQILHRAGDEIWRIGCQACILSESDYQQLTQELTEITRTELAGLKGGAPACTVTGLVPIFLRTQQALLESLIRSFAVAFVLIGSVMAVQLRSVTAALIAMLPNVLPVLIVFGLISALGIRVDVGTMITASVAMGIAVDGTLHMLEAFRDGLRQRLDRRTAAELALGRCGPALWQSSAVIALGMLALFPVELLLISRFGWIMAALVAAALWGDAVLLPALLAGPLGAVLEAADGRQTVKLTAVQETQEKDADPAVSQIFELADFPADEPELQSLAQSALRGPHFSLRNGTPLLGLNGEDDVQTSGTRPQKA